MLNTTGIITTMGGGGGVGSNITDNLGSKQYFHAKTN